MNLLSVQLKKKKRVLEVNSLETSRKVSAASQREPKLIPNTTNNRSSRMKIALLLRARCCWSMFHIFEQLQLCEGWGGRKELKHFGATMTMMKIEIYERDDVKGLLREFLNFHFRLRLDTWFHSTSVDPEECTLVTPSMWPAVESTSHTDFSFIFDLFPLLFFLLCVIEFVSKMQMDCKSMPAKLLIRFTYSLNGGGIVSFCMHCHHELRKYSLSSVRPRERERRGDRSRWRNK